MEDNDLRRRRTHEIGNMGPTSPSTEGTPGKRTLTQGATRAVTPAASLVQSQAVGHEAPEIEDKDSEKDNEKEPDKEKDGVLSTDSNATQEAKNPTPPPEQQHEKPAGAPHGQLPRLDLGKKRASAVDPQKDPSSK